MVEKSLESDKPVRGYHIAHKAWYAPACDIILPQITIGLFYTGAEQGGTDGEMIMYWVKLDGNLHPMLECFSDAFRVLDSFQDVISAAASLKDKNDVFTPDEFVALLDGCGFQDLTDYVRKTSPSLFVATQATSPEDSSDAEELIRRFAPRFRSKSGNKHKD